MHRQLTLIIKVQRPMNNRLHQHAPEEDNNFSYYHEYCRLYLANVVLTSQMKQLIAERSELLNRFSKIEKKAEQIQYGGSNEEDRKKRFRRTASEIERHYRCSVETCQKSYGSEGSLNQHIKLKHYELYKTMPHLSQSQDEEYSMSESIQQKRSNIR